jgi:MarR family transcriptional regulator, organic hydroperoxide resistance regulator
LCKYKNRRTVLAPQHDRGATPVLPMKTAPRINTKSIRSVRHRKMLEVLALFRIVFKSIRQHYGIVERRTGISGAQLWALAQIAEHPGITVGELARALAVHQSTASNLLRELEAAGLLNRKKVREDLRSVRLQATAKGHAVLKRAPRPLIGVLQQALSDLPSANLDAMHRQLQALIAAMAVKASGARVLPLSEI